MSIMRVNFSHATVEEVELRTTNLAAAMAHEATAGVNNLRAVLLDTKGPEIRTGGLQAVHETGDRKAKIELKTGDEILLTTDPAWADCSDEKTLYVTYGEMYDTVKVDMPVLLDDGAVTLTVLEISDSGVRCRIENDGDIASRRGVNLPGSKLQLPPMSEKDKSDIRYGIGEKDMDFVAASFVRKPSDVTEIRDWIKVCHKEFHSDDHPLPLIISKIESTEALDNLDAIIEVSDGIMVARGDLGVEIPLEEVTFWQKEMVKKCNLLGKPVIVATQMLETMQKNPRPTRAEVSDVANALLDGADCVMLSGESANGSYPVESVRTMRSIIDKTEKWMPGGPSASMVYSHSTDTVDAAASGAVITAEKMEAACIIVMTTDGNNVRSVAKYRPNEPVVAVCDKMKVARQLNIHRAVQPVMLAADEDLASVAVTDMDKAIRLAKKYGYCEAGDNVVIMDSDSAIRIKSVP